MEQPVARRQLAHRPRPRAEHAVDEGEQAGEVPVDRPRIRRVMPAMEAGAHEDPIEPAVRDAHVGVDEEAVDAPHRGIRRHDSGLEAESEERARLEQLRREVLDGMEPLVAEPVDVLAAVMDRMEGPEPSQVEEAMAPVGEQVAEHECCEERWDGVQLAEDGARSEQPLELRVHLERRCDEAHRRPVDGRAEQHDDVGEREIRQRALAERALIRHRRRHPLDAEEQEAEERELPRVVPEEPPDALAHEPCPRSRSQGGDPAAQNMAAPRDGWRQERVRSVRVISREGRRASSTRARRATWGRDRAP